MKSINDDTPEIPQESQATTEIHNWINENLNKRELDTNVNRASAAPACVRKRWYKAHGYPGEVMQPRAIITFAFGDAVEHIAKYFIANACVGPGKLYSEVDFGEKDGTFTIQHRLFDIYKQEAVKIKIAGLEVTGHGDGWGKRNSDGQWEYIEVKSSATFRFDKFVRGERPDYIRQVHAIMMSDKAQKLGVTSSRFFYMDKNTSHIFDRLYYFDEAVADQVRREFLQAISDQIPPIPYPAKDETFRSKPTGRVVLDYPCSYCEYKAECRPEFKLQFKNGKPIFVRSEAV